MSESVAPSSQTFAFGRNWQSFLAQVDEPRIASAADSLRRLLQVNSLQGKRFLDLGSGSGLFSLAAHRLGAEVVSIDFDSDSVACTRQLRDRFGQSTPPWRILSGSVLDTATMQAIGQADVVYSWGVLHHTGDLWRATAMAAGRTAPGGLLGIAIYNDQGSASRRWLRIKQTYHRLPRWLRPCWVLSIATVYEVRFALARLAHGRNPLPFADWRQKRRERGMSAWHDWVDWVGGLPFETATPEQIDAYLQSLGFQLQRSRLVGKGWGCNEFVFQRSPRPEGAPGSGIDPPLANQSKPASSDAEAGGRTA